MLTKVAVVTGSNKGIGLAIVRVLCKQFDGDVYITSRDVGRGEEAVKVLNSEGMKPKFHQLDINDLNSIKTAAAYFKEKYGGVDILINNAGIAFKDMSTKVAVVTGSNKGISLAIVRALCKQFDGDVYVTSRDVGWGEEAVKVLNSEGLKPKFHQLDINDLNSIKTAAAYFKEKYGGVDVLINNAGTAFKASDTTPFGVQAEVTLKTNFFATRDMSTHFLPMIRAGDTDAELDPVYCLPLLL